MEIDFMHQPTQVEVSGADLIRLTQKGGEPRL